MTDTLARIADRITTARSRAEMGGAPWFITVTAPADPGDDLLGFLMAQDDPDMAYWEQPDYGFGIGAVGVAHRFDFSPDDDRFRRAAAELRAMRSQTAQVALEGAERAAVLLGGFSFFEASGWPDFPSGRLTLPELALIRRPTGSVWMAAAAVGPDIRPDALAARLVARIEGAQRGGRADVVPAEPDYHKAAAVDLREPSYLKAVESALETIGGGALSKVVLARRLAVEHRPDLGSFLARLRDRYPTCATFAFRSGERVFCGATPERLVRLDGVSISTAAVAGTAPRGSDETQDEVIADRLRHDPKELAEHRFVIQDIQRRLGEANVVIDPQAETRVMRLPGLQHLSTPLGGTAPVGTNVLDMVGAMHPTPAVAGLPSPDAIEWIAAHEPMERGWYAGPVGYCDLAGNGEFRVGLRCGLIDPTASTLFAGAGIVEGSLPERELEETGLKLGALLAPLLGA